MSAPRMPRTLLIAMLVSTLAACGGGGGGGGGGAPPPDSEPDAFTIPAVVGATRNSSVVSQAVTIQGINAPASVSITGGEYAVNGGAFTSAVSTVTNAQSIVVRVTASSTPGGVSEATLTVGSVAAKLTVTASTAPPDTEPDAFTIPPVADAVRGSTVISQGVAIRGIDDPASVSIAGGEYSVNGGAFTSAAGSVTNAQSVVVRVTASSTPGGVVEATLTVGSVPGKFAVTTSTDVTPPTATVVFPTQRSRTSSEQLIVRGTATDTDSPVTSVRVNNVEASSTDGFATWIATVPLAPGLNKLAVDAMDRALNRGAAMPAAEVTRNALIGFIEGLAFDAAQNRVIASESSGGGLLSIDLTTGLRTVIPNTITPLASMTFDRLVLPSSVTLEANGTHALVLDRSGPAAILRVNLTTGARTVVSGRGFPNTQNELGNNAMAMSVDLVNGRAYVLTRAPDSILSVDLATGARAVLSDAATGAGPLFPNPMTLGIDPARNRLLVGDQGSSGSGFAIYTVDLLTVPGARAILSSDTLPNANNPLSFVGGFAIDGNRALVTQHQAASVLAVDLVTGDRTIYSDATTPNTDNAFVQPRVIAIDSAGGRAFVADSQLRSLFAVALSDGERTVVSPNEAADIGDPQLYSTGVALDAGSNRIYVTDPLSRSLLAVNLATGTRTRVSSDTVPFGPAWNFPHAVVLDGQNNRALVVDGYDISPAVYSVALDTGARSVLSANGSQSGVAFGALQSLALDRDSNRVLVTDFGLNAVVAVDLPTGTRTILSEPFTLPSGIVLDETGQRALVTHLGPPSVVAVDLSTGQQSVLSTAGNTGTWLPIGIGIDAATRTIVSGDEALAALHIIDPVNGTRALVSSPTLPRPNDKLTPRGIAVDGTRRIAWVSNGGFAILQIVDLVTGERVFLTR